MYGEKILDNNLNESELSELCRGFKSEGERVDPKVPYDNENYTQVEAINDFVEYMGEYLSNEQLHCFTARLIEYECKNNQLQVCRNDTLARGFIIYEATRHNFGPKKEDVAAFLACQNASSLIDEIIERLKIPAVLLDHLHTHIAPLERKLKQGKSEVEIARAIAAYPIATVYFFLFDEEIRNLAAEIQIKFYKIHGELSADKQKDKSVTKKYDDFKKKIVEQIELFEPAPPSLEEDIAKKSHQELGEDSNHLLEELYPQKTEERQDGSQVDLSTSSHKQAETSPKVEKNTKVNHFSENTQAALLILIFVPIVLMPITATVFLLDWAVAQMRGESSIASRVTNNIFGFFCGKTEAENNKGRVSEMNTFQR